MFACFLVEVTSNLQTTVMNHLHRRTSIDSVILLYLSEQPPELLSAYEVDSYTRTYKGQNSKLNRDQLKLSIPIYSNPRTGNPNLSQPVYVGCSWSHEMILHFSIFVETPHVCLYYVHIVLYIRWSDHIKLRSHYITLHVYWCWCIHYLRLFKTFQD
jgi:hypothetical protein